MCLGHTAPQTFDAARADAFGARMVDSLNQGALCLMLSIGHRTGLLDTMRELPPSSSPAIAEAAGLHERYVREWLGAMVTGGVVEYDADTRTYRLPAEHAAFLTRGAGSDNVAVFAQYVPVLAQVEDRILDCFRAGGGVGYEHYGRFHEVMAEDSGLTVLGSLFDHILPLAPGLVERLHEGIRVLDLGCGRGRAVIRMAREFPHSTFLGYDLSVEAIEHARHEVERLGLTNVRFEVRDLSDFDRTADPAAFDLVTTFDAVHDQARPLALLRGIRRTLAEDGIYLMQDIRASSELQHNLEHPVGTLLYTVSTLHCMTVSLAQGGDGLGTMWGRERALELLQEAGFGSTDVHELEHDFQNDYYVVRG